MPEILATEGEPEVAQDTPERRSSRALVMLALLVAMVALGALVVGTRKAGVDQAQAPNFTLPSLEGGGDTVSLTMRGDRPAVVNFFASWCAPCRRELPHFAAESRRLEGEVAFIGVAHQDDAELAAEMLDEFDIAYPAGNDPAGDVAREYSLRGMPSTAFVAADGTLVGVAAGELDAGELQDWIKRLVAT